MKKIYIVAWDSTWHYCRLSKKELNTLKDLTCVGPFDTMKQARQYMILHIISLAKYGFYKAAEELVPKVFEKPI